MKLFKAKANFFSGSYYKELFRELTVFGIIFTVIQLFFGISGEFGKGGVLDFLTYSRFDIGMNGTHSDCFGLFFFVCTLQFLSTHISRRNWDFRNSLPLAKRTMFTCHFAAVLTWAAIIFAANYLGVLIGEGIRLASASTSVPDGFGMSAVSMLRSIMDGVTMYCAMIILASIVNRIFPVLGAIAVIIGIPALFPIHTYALSEYRMVSRELLLPLGIRGSAVFETVISIAFMLLLIVLAYIAFGKSRVETFQRPARTKLINTLIGVLGAGCVGLIAGGISAAYIYETVNTHGVPIYEYTPWYVSTLIYGGIAMVCAYFIYMWITTKKAKSALKSCVFAPIGFLIVGASVLLAVIADNKAEKLDFSVDNIDHIRVIHTNFTTTDDYSSEFMFDRYGDFGSRVFRGDSGVYEVKITDEKLIKGISECAEATMRTAETPIYGLIRFLDNSLDYIRPVEVTLKDGTKWAVSGGTPRIINITSIADNKELIEELASLDRFKNGRVIAPVALGSEFDKTLLDELASLSALDRAAALNGMIRAEIDPYAEYEDALSGIEQLRITLTLVSPTYDHVASIVLSDKLPKTTELYMKLMSERVRQNKGYGEFMEKLKSAEFGQLGMTLLDMSLGARYNGTFRVYRGEPYFNGESFVSEVPELTKLIAECIEANEPIHGAERVIGFKINDFGVFEQRLSGSWTTKQPLGYESLTVFVGISEKKAKELNKLVRRVNEIELEFFGANDPYYEKYANYIAKEIENGGLTLFDVEGYKLNSDEFFEMFYKGQEVFYDAEGNAMHISEIYDELIEG